MTHQKAHSEPITLIGLDEARARGSQVEAANTLEGNPHALEIGLQGSEAENAAAKAQVEPVARAVASLKVARTRREQFDPVLEMAAKSWVASEKEAKRTQAEVDERRRMLPLLPFGSGVVFLLLMIIAAAEFVLNRAAFEITGEDSLNIDVLAVAVGVGLVAAAHFLGIALRRIVDRVPGAALSPAALLVASVGGALVIAILSINTLREAFFAESELPVPGGALAWLQVFLLWVAVALSAAHAHPLKENLTRVRSHATAQRKSFEKARSEWAGLFDKHAEAHSRTWAVVAAGAADADIQLAHTERARQAFAQGAKSALPLARIEPNRIGKAWHDWLDRNPVELQTPAVLSEVLKLIAQMNDETELTTDLRSREDPVHPVDGCSLETPITGPSSSAGEVSEMARDAVDLSDLENEFDQLRAGK